MLSRKINNIAGFLSRRRLILNHLSSISTSRSNFFAENGRGLNQNLGEDFEEFERSISFPARKYDRSENISESNSISKQNNAYKSSQHYSKSEDTLLYQASRDPSVIPKFLENFDQWWFDFCNRLMNMSPGRLSYAVKTLGDVNKSSNGLLRKKINRPLIRSLETQFVLADDSLIRAWDVQYFLLGLVSLQNYTDFYSLGGYPSRQFTNKVVKFFQNDNDQSTDSGVADVLFCDCIHKLSVLRTYPDAESIHFIVEKMKDVMHSWQNRLEKIIKSIEKLDIDNHDFSDPNVSDRGNGDYFNGTEIVSEMLRFLVIHNEIASTFINWHFDPDQCVTQAQQQIASFWRTWFKNAKHAFALSSTEKFHSISLKIVDQSKERYFWGLEHNTINGLLLCLGANCCCVAEQYDRLPELLNIEHSIGQTCLQIFPQFRQNVVHSSFAEDRVYQSLAPFYATLALEIAVRRCGNKIRVQTLLMNSKKSTSDKKRYPNFYEDVHLLKGDKVFLKLCGRLQRWDVFHRDRLRQAATDNNYGNDRRPHQLTEILLAAGTMETFGPIFSIYYSKANIILFKMMGVRKKKQKNDGDESQIDSLNVGDIGEVFVEESSQDVVDELKLVPNAQVETAIDDIDDSNFTHDVSPGQTKISSKTSVSGTFGNLTSISENKQYHSPENESCDHTVVSNACDIERSEDFIEQQYFKSLDDKEEPVLLRDQAKNVTDDIFDEFGKKFKKSGS